MNFLNRTNFIKEINKRKQEVRKYRVRLFFETMSGKVWGKDRPLYRDQEGINCREAAFDACNAIKKELEETGYIEFYSGLKLHKEHIVSIKVRPASLWQDWFLK
ncbi:MAG: hypothetical protein F4X82_01840 [Candidatus Spechtbacteria bacterium SB0662_bin_43]|uniref:Uncharacterized protein n=1 Tax=Candidatus Spechtbacteria bacterium SB0662_bin_43 TaxID=2604897 RepID=A0A845DC60_9BACT|nr:hypothetical protein [Candidatus Spechtbacteria bacterium SB0662_bin_43]